MGVLVLPASRTTEKRTPDEEAGNYGVLALVWADLRHEVFAGANARIAAHIGYLAIGRGQGRRQKVIPFFDRRPASTTSRSNSSASSSPRSRSGK